ncbi:lipopolysaccharide biosynthesis protein [Agrococcus carbonis]|nr:lipopolysaccharide biosynthesis protein [Agrococcus carbonis]
MRRLVPEAPRPEAVVEDAGLPDAPIAGTLQPPAIGGRAASGIVWMTLQKWVIRIFGFATIVLLARLLAPEDFGTVAAAGVVLPFFYLLADLGFAAYIVQVQEADQRMLSTAFWFSLTAGAVLSGVLVATAPLFGLAFSDDRVVPVLQVLSAWVVLTAVGSVPSAMLRRAMRFRAIAAQGAIGAVVAQVVAVAMALAGLGVAALVAQSLVACAVTTALAWHAAKWRPTLAFSREEFRRMAGFGSQVLSVELVAMLRASGEAAVISRTLGVAALGSMTIAQRLVQIVQELTGSAIVPVTNVAFAKIRDSSARLRSAYLRALRLTYAALSLPMVVIAVGAPQLVPLLFGDQWTASVAPAQVLAVASVLALGAWLDHGLFYGLGRPGTWLVYAVVIDALTLATTIVAAQWGLVAIAWGFLGVAVLATVVRWFLVARALETSVGVVAGPCTYLVAVVAVSGAAGWGAGVLAAGAPTILALLAIGAAVLVGHAAVTAVGARDVVRDAAGILRRAAVRRGQERRADR